MPPFFGLLLQWQEKCGKIDGEAVRAHAPTFVGESPEGALAPQAPVRPAYRAELSRMGKTKGKKQGQNERTAFSGTEISLEK